MTRPNVPLTTPQRARLSQIEQSLLASDIEESQHSEPPPSFSEEDIGSDDDEEVEDEAVGGDGGDGNNDDDDNDDDTDGNYDGFHFISLVNELRYQDEIRFFEIVSGTWIDTKSFDKLKSTLIWINLFKEQGWDNFLKLRENTYPDLVKKFYANLTFSKDGNGSRYTGIRSRVKGKVLKYSARDLAKIFGFKDHSQDGLFYREGVTSLDNLVHASHQVVGHNIFKPGVQIPNAKFPDASHLKFQEKIIQMLITRSIRPQKSGKDGVSNLTAFLIYALKHKLPIDIISVFLSFMESEPKRSKLPYGMALTRLFRHAGVEFSGEDVIMPTGQGFSSRNLTQAGMTYNPATKEWRWDGRIVASLSIDPLSPDPSVFTAIYGSAPVAIDKKGRAVGGSRGRKRPRTSDAPSSPLPAPAHVESPPVIPPEVGPSSGVRRKKSVMKMMFDFMKKTTSKLFHRLDKAKRTRKMLLEQNRYLFQHPVERPPTALFDYVESDDSEGEVVVSSEEDDI